MTDLGSLGYGVSYAFGINASAQITGRSYLTQTAPVSGCPPLVPLIREGDRCLSVGCR